MVGPRVGKSKIKLPASYLVRRLFHICTVILLLSVSSHGQLQVLCLSHES